MDLVRAYDVDACWPMETAQQFYHIIGVNAHHLNRELIIDDANQRTLFGMVVTPTIILRGAGRVSLDDSRVRNASAVLLYNITLTKGDNEIRSVSIG